MAKLLLLLYTFAVLTVIVSSTGKIPSMDLEHVVSMSVCPIVVDYDEDENRIPRSIKILRCSQKPNPVCRREKVSYACCRSHHHRFSTECVNVMDHMLVRYTNRGDDTKLYKLPVLVGCTCMIREETMALEDRRTADKSL